MDICFILWIIIQYELLCSVAQIVSSFHHCLGVLLFGSFISLTYPHPWGLLVCYILSIFLFKNRMLYVHLVYFLSGS